MKKITPYVKRQVEFIRRVESGDWRLKIYGISASSKSVSHDIVDKAVARVLPNLPEPAHTANRYGAGFLIIHQGTLRNWFLLDWWEFEDILCHKLFSSPLDDPDAITPERESSAFACVHELRVINFESQAWIKTVLGDNPKSGVEAYLELRFDNDGQGRLEN